MITTWCISSLDARELFSFCETLKQIDAFTHNTYNWRGIAFLIDDIKKGRKLRKVGLICLVLDIGLGLKELCKLLIKKVWETIVVGYVICWVFLQAMMLSYCFIHFLNFTFHAVVVFFISKKISWKAQYSPYSSSFQNGIVNWSIWIIKYLWREVWLHALMFNV